MSEDAWGARVRGWGAGADALPDLWTFAALARSIGGVTSELAGSGAVAGSAA